MMRWVLLFEVPLKFQVSKVLSWCGFSALSPVPLGHSFSPLLCRIRGFPDVTSNPCSIQHYGNLTSSLWAVKDSEEGVWERAYASHISILLRRASTHSYPRWGDPSCFNRNIGDDLIITLLYMMWKFSWYMAVLSQKLIWVFEKQPPPWGVCACVCVCVDWPDWCLHIYSAMWLEWVMTSSYSLLQINLWLTYNDSPLGWTYSKSNKRTSPVLEDYVKVPALAPKAAARL